MSGSATGKDLLNEWFFGQSRAPFQEPTTGTRRHSPHPPAAPKPPAPKMPAPKTPRSRRDGPVEKLARLLTEGIPGRNATEQNANFSRWFNNCQYLVSLYPDIIKEQEPILALTHIVNHIEASAANARDFHGIHDGADFVLWPHQDRSSKDAEQYIREDLLPIIATMLASRALKPAPRDNIIEMLDRANAASSAFSLMAFSAGIRISQLKDQVLAVRFLSETINSEAEVQDIKKLAETTSKIYQIILHEIERGELPEANAIANGVLEGTLTKFMFIAPMNYDSPEIQDRKLQLFGKETINLFTLLREGLTALKSATNSDDATINKWLSEGLKLKGSLSKGEQERASLVRALLIAAQNDEDPAQRKAFLKIKADTCLALLKQRSGFMKSKSERGHMLAHALMALNQKQLKARYREIAGLINPALRPAHRLTAHRRESMMPAPPTRPHDSHEVTTGSGRHLRINTLGLEGAGARGTDSASNETADEEKLRENHSSSRQALLSSYARANAGRRDRLSRVSRLRRAGTSEPIPPSVSPPCPPSALPPPPPITEHPRFNPVTGRISASPPSATSPSLRSLGSAASAASGRALLDRAFSGRSLDDVNTQPPVARAATLLRQASNRSASTTGSDRELLASQHSLDLGGLLEPEG